MYMYHTCTCHHNRYCLVILWREREREEEGETERETERALELEVRAINNCLVVNRIEVMSPIEALSLFA